MAFCRRCGDIVSGTRCKCGGTPVAPVVPWNQSSKNDSEKQDRWSRTYVSHSKSTSPTRSTTTQPTDNVNNPPPPQRSPTPGRRFPRPLSSFQSSSSIGDRVSAYINNSTSQSSHPPSPLKQAITGPAPEADILPSITPNDSTLSKVYGSLLQPKETLQSYSCAICLTPFPPDATIYPHPTAPSTSQYLCRPCFEENGGSKGPCPTCSRPVLALKAEGGFIHANGQYWHKRCFKCDGCSKNIGDTPMVDLFGRPSCASCFDTCLKRDPTTPKKQTSTSQTASPRVPRPSSAGSTPDLRRRQSGEGSPAFVEELEQRLGILRSREGSPAIPEFSVKPSEIAGDAPLTRPRRSDSLPPKPHGAHPTSPQVQHEVQHIRASLDPGTTITRLGTSLSTTRTRADSVEHPPHDAVTAMKLRFLKNSISVTHQEGLKKPALRPSRSPTSLKSPDRPQPRGDYLDDDSDTSPRFVRTRSRGNDFDKTPLPPLRYDQPSLTRVYTIQTNQPEDAFTPPVSKSTNSRWEKADDDKSTTSPGSGLALELSDSMSQASLSELDSTPPPNYGEALDDIFSIHNVMDGQLDHHSLQRGLFEDLSKALMPENTGGPNVQVSIPLEPLTRETSIRVVHTGDTGNFDTTPNLKPIAELPALIEEDDDLSDTTRCAGCRQNLFSVRSECRFVNVPGDHFDSGPVSYHVECFKCIICKDIFSETPTGQAAFVKIDGGPCHVECAPIKKITIHKSPSLGSLKLNTTPSTPRPVMKSPPSYRTSTRTSSSRLEQAPLSPPVTTNTTGRRFGSSASCPGCKKSVSPMEPGVVPGPHGTRWHASCLVCGGKKEPVKGRPMSWLVREEKKKGEPGCGKKLDSAAKSGPEGGVWCRECLLLIGIGGSPQTSPTKSSAASDDSGPISAVARVPQQSTGSTTLARQFTGMGSGGEAGLSRQLTGSTRSISPTKQLNATRPRPKSVIGMRSAKSVDERRGMFLLSRARLGSQPTAGAVLGSDLSQSSVSDAMRSRVALVGVTFHDVVVEAALNTIPLTSIGITAFAAFTTVLILRRLNATSALLYLSAFSSLAASILDLGQLIFKVSDDKGHVTLINAREVGFALSYGFSYLFYWLLVARCPRGESVFENQDHSASWTRWGLVGLILKWGLLALILADFILQIVWRVSPQGVKSGTVYITESTIQIIVSAILVLKLLLNMLISPLASLWSRLSSNIVPLIGLGLSAALAIANIITRAFSETTLGRFFRAVELYLLIVFAVIFSLKGSERRRLSDSLSSPKIDEKFIDPRATAYQNPIGVLVRRRSSIIGERLRRPSQRASTLSRIMSKATQKYETSRDGDTLFTTTPANGSSDSNEGKDMHSFLPNAKSSDFVPPRPIGGRPTTNTSIPSYYGMVRNSAASLTRDTISPIYGLNGIAPPNPNLLGHVDELDQSIAALKFISRQADSSPELAQVMLASKMPEKLNRGSILDRVPASITGPRIESNRSEFSLSVFPEPPNRSVLEVAPAGRQKVVLPETSGNLKVLDSATPNYIGQYNPNGRFGSTGTAYDVTSFIGGLTIESGGGPMSTAAPSSGVASTLGRIAEMPELGSRRASPELPSRSARRESQPLLFRPVKFRGKDGVQKMISQPQRLSSKETPGAFEQPRRPPIVG